MFNHKKHDIHQLANYKYSVFTPPKIKPYSAKMWRSKADPLWDFAHSSLLSDI
jgi:hypothetical protein